MARLQNLWLALLRAIPKLIGNWGWRPPEWLARSGRSISTAVHFILADARRVAAVVLLLAATIAGTLWYRGRPTPHYVAYTVTEPPLTTYDYRNNPEIHPLHIE